jgi:GntR family transcriptional repressor for pyruvate dehydrogenase complex
VTDIREELRDVRLEAFRPVRVRKAADEVVAVLADAIRGGLYRPGDLLPRQADLATQLEVSRHVVREAIEVLRRAGIVSVKRGNSGGALVESRENVPRVLASIGGETHANVLAMLEARRPIELAAAPLAAARAKRADFARLQSLVDELDDLIDRGDDFLHADARFHLTMIELSANPLLVESYQRFLDQMLLASSLFPVGRIDPTIAIDHQRRTLRALESRDRRRILRAMDAHLAALEEVFLGEKLPFP